jgi:hypothetical protein
MAFTIRDMADLTRLLGEHPEWRGELRRLVLTDELLGLPDVVLELTLGLRQLTERVDVLTERVDQLTQRVDLLTQRMAQLADGMDQLTQRMDQLLASHQRMLDDIGGMKGKMLEMEYGQKASAVFSRVLRRPRAVDPAEMWDVMEARLAPEDLDDVMLADVFVTGTVRSGGAEETMLVVEVSFVVDRYDVERAARRAKLMRQAGFRAVPVAAGVRLTAGSKEAALEEGVALLEQRQPIYWEEALRALAA